MPPPNPTRTAGTLASDHELGSFLASAGKNNIKAATPRSMRNVDGLSTNIRLEVAALGRKYGLSWGTATSTPTPLRKPTSTGCGVNLITFATPASPKTDCHRPASATHKKTATIIKSLSCAAA